jgi:hypothetical protein
MIEQPLSTYSSAAHSSEQLCLSCVYAKADGLSYFTDVFVPYVGKTKAGTSWWTDIFDMSAWKAARLEPGQREWHPNPNPAISVLLQGVVETRVGGSAFVRRSAPGDISLSLDASGQGHLTNVIGPHPAYALILMMSPVQVQSLSARLLGWPKDIVLPEAW